MVIRSERRPGHGHYHGFLPPVKHSGDRPGNRWDLRPERRPPGARRAWTGQVSRFSTSPVVGCGTGSRIS